MSPYPYRIKKLRTHSTVAIVNEEDSVREANGLVIWRISDREFRVHQAKNRPGAEQMVSQRPSNVVCCLDVSQVRDWHPYLHGEPLPWPDCTTPPDCIDSEEKLIGALTAPNGSGEKKPTAATRPRA